MTGRQVEASPEEPRYEVRFSLDGKEAQVSQDRVMHLLMRQQIENERTQKRSALKESNILGPAD